MVDRDRCETDTCAAADVLLLMDFVKTRGEGVTLAASGDLTGDGMINNADILRLMKTVQ